MIPPKLMRSLVAWLRARVPEVSDNVQSAKASPNDTAPYLTYAGVSNEPVMDLDARGAHQGRAGFNHTRVQVDVWDTDELRAAEIAVKIQGDEDNPGGLNGWQGWFPAHDADGRVAVQACFLVDAESDAEDADDGSEVTWYRERMDFMFHYAET
jgi:hypothetical protein